MNNWRRLLSLLLVLCLCMTLSPLSAVADYDESGNWVDDGPGEGGEGLCPHGDDPMTCPFCNPDGPGGMHETGWYAADAGDASISATQVNVGDTVTIEGRIYAYDAAQYEMPSLLFSTSGNCFDWVSDYLSPECLYDESGSYYAYSYVFQAQSAGTDTISVDLGPSRFTDMEQPLCSFTVTVNSSSVAVTGVTLVAESLTLAPQETWQLTATVLPYGATDPGVSWQSSNPDAVSVSEAGLVTALCAGEAVITVTTEDGGFTASCAVTVTAPEPEPGVAVTGVTLDAESLELAPQETWQLTVTVLPSDADNLNISWQSSNPDAVSVSEEGLVTALSVGEALITVTTEDGGFTAGCAVTVAEPRIPVTGVTLDAESLELLTLETRQLTATIAPDDASNLNLSWESSNPDAATVSDGGLVTAVGAGETLITVTTEDGGFTADCAVTVTAPVVTVTLDAESLQLTPKFAYQLNDSYQLTATVETTGTVTPGLVWTSSAPNVAAVDENGLVTTDAMFGEAVITAATEDGSASASCLVSVVQSHACGDNLSWALSGDGVLTISGSGPMWNYQNSRPDWFSESESIKTVVIENGVTSIGDHAFSWELRWTNENGNSVSSYGYCQNLRSAVIAETVTSIGDSAFYSCSKLAEIRLPSGLTTLGERVFCWCQSIRELNIPYGVTKLGINTLTGTGITKLVIPASVTEVALAAASYCQSLTTIRFLGSMPSINSGAFHDSGVQRYSSTYENITVYYPVGDPSYTADNMQNYGATKLVWRPMSETAGENLSWQLVNGTLTISGSGPMWEFSESFRPAWDLVSGSVTSVVLESGVTTVGAYAFRDYSNLTSVTLPATVTRVGDWAFGRCTALGSFTLPANLSSIGAYAFLRCSLPAGFALPQGLTQIGDWAFSQCDNCPNELVIPGRVTSMGENAFSFCDMTSLTLSEGVTVIGSQAFSFCERLTTVSLPNSLTSIGEEAFQYCQALSGITIPRNVTSMGEKAFSYCPALNSAVIHCQNLGPRAFEMCSSLTDVVISSTVRTIDHHAFINCAALRSLDIAEGLTSIGESAFVWDRSLQHVSLPQSLTSIGRDAFSACGLRSVEIPDGVTSISPYAFNNCGNLTSVIIGSGVTFIGENAFNYTDLNTVVLRGNLPAFEEDNSYLTGLTQEKVLYYPSGNSTYTSAKLNKYFSGVTCKAYALGTELPLITSQPASFVGAVGSTASFTVAATGSGLSYRWYSRALSENEWTQTNITGATYSFTVTEAHNGCSYYCAVTDSQGITVDSDVVSVDIPLVIVDQPIDFNGAVGDTASFTVVASGAGLSYQWYYKTATGTKWNKSLLTSSTYSTTVKEKYDGYSYYCVVTDNRGNELQTDVVYLHIPFVIVTQPTDYYGAVGDTAVFTVKAGGLDLSYQWYYKTPTGTKWSKSSQTGSSYSLTIKDKHDGYSFYCVVTDGSGNVKQTDIVSIHIPFEITAQPVDFTGPIGSTASFTVEAVGSGLSYQWYYRTSDTGSWVKSTISCSTTNTYSYIIAAKHNRYSFYCVVTDSKGRQLQTDVVSIHVPLEITTQPVDFSGVAGDTAVFTTEAVGAGVTYQWYYKTATGKKWHKSSQKGVTYSITISNTLDGYSYYCLVTDNNNNEVQSDVVTIHVPLKITSQPTDYYGTVDSTAAFSLEASGEGLSYQWYYRLQNKTRWNKSSLKSSTYSTTAKEKYDGYSYYCSVTDAQGYTVNTDVVWLRIVPEITTQPVDCYASAGNAASFMLTASGGGLNYQWYYRLPSATKWNKSSLTSSTYSTTAKEKYDGYSYYCVVSNANGSVQSDVVTLHILHLPTIFQQPKSVTAAVGEDAIFNTKASGDELSYQWFMRPASGTEWTACGETYAQGKVLVVDVTAADNGNVYRCEVSNASGTVSTEEVTLTVGG